MYVFLSEFSLQYKCFVSLSARRAPHFSVVIQLAEVTGATLCHVTADQLRDPIITVGLRIYLEHNFSVSFGIVRRTKS